MIKAILTGHSKGLGLGIARALLSQGHAVLGISRSHHPELQHKYNDKLQQISLDLAQPTAVQQLESSPQFQEFIANTTQLLLINNAGLVSPIGPLSAQSIADISRSVQLNVAVPLALSAMITRTIQDHQQLRILHVSSGAAQSAYPGWSVYCATKAALDMHARAVQEDQISNVTICSLAPGVIDTAMQTQIRETDESLFPNKQRFIQLKNSNSLSNPDETGKRLVHYLLSPNFGKLAVDDLRTY
jgi:benzil reductase ((S)-benzoin forming)